MTTVVERVRRSPALLAAVALLVTAVLGYALGRSHDPVHYETGVECHSAEGAISCELDDDWTVSIPLDVMWTDTGGSPHEGDRPDCLPPTGRGLEGPVSLAWVPVEVDGMGWRQVVWVGC